MDHFHLFLQNFTIKLFFVFGLFPWLVDFSEVIARVAMTSRRLLVGFSVALRIFESSCDFPVVLS